jgi:hypothetical protein
MIKYKITIALRDIGESFPLQIKDSCKREIYHCHYVMLDYHSNELWSIKLSHKLKVSKEKVSRSLFNLLRLFIIH